MVQEIKVAGPVQILPTHFKHVYIPLSKKKDLYIPSAVPKKK